MNFFTGRWDGSVVPDPYNLEFHCVNLEDPTITRKGPMPLSDLLQRIILTLRLSRYPWMVFNTWVNPFQRRCSRFSVDFLFFRLRTERVTTSLGCLELIDLCRFGVWYWCCCKLVDICRFGVSCELIDFCSLSCCKLVDFGSLGDCCCIDPHQHGHLTFFGIEHSNISFSGTM